VPQKLEITEVFSFLANCEFIFACCPILLFEIFLQNFQQISLEKQISKLEFKKSYN